MDDFYAATWTDFTPPLTVENSLNDVKITFDTSISSVMNSATDEYHAYLMMNWLLALRKFPTFTEKFNGRTPNFSLPQKEPAVLQILSNALYATRIAKSMTKEECVESLARLSPNNVSLLSGALASTPQTEKLLSHYSQGIFNAKNFTL